MWAGQILNSQTWLARHTHVSSPAFYETSPRLFQRLPMWKLGPCMLSYVLAWLSAERWWSRLNKIVSLQEPTDALSLKLSWTSKVECLKLNGCLFWTSFRFQEGWGPCCRTLSFNESLKQHSKHLVFLLLWNFFSNKEIRLLCMQSFVFRSCTICF